MIKKPLEKGAQKAAAAEWLSKLMLTKLFMKVGRASLECQK